MNQGGKLLSSDSNRGGKYRVSAIVILLAIVYVVFLLYQSVYFNYQRSQKIKSLRKDIITLETKQKKIESLIAYYKTESFQELEARKKLGLKMPGEMVVKVDVKDQNNGDALTQEKTNTNKTKPKANVELWIDFVTGKLNKV